MPSVASEANATVDLHADAECLALSADGVGDFAGRAEARERVAACVDGGNGHAAPRMQCAAPDRGIAPADHAAH